MKPTPRQALLLFSLLARHGEARQGELMPAVTAADREVLAKARFIGVETVGRSYRLTLLDEGWAFVSANPDAELPPPFRSLSDLLMRLAEHFARVGGTLPELIGPKPPDAAGIGAEKTRETAEVKARASEEKRAKAEARDAKAREAERKRQRAAQDRKAKAEAKAAQPKSPRRPAAPRRPRPPTQAALRQRIEAAYLTLTAGRKDESVRLAPLRAALADLDRPTLDAALGRILQGDSQGRRKAMLMRHDDPAQIAPADRDAAFNPSGEPFHVLWIAS